MPTEQALDPRSLLPNPNKGWPVVSTLWRRWYRLMGARAKVDPDFASHPGARGPSFAPPSPL